MANFREISPKEIAQWFRARAKQFNEIAASVEAAFGAASPAARMEVVHDFSEIRSAEPLTVDHIKQALKRGNFRVKKLAWEFAVPETEVRRIIKAPNSGLRIGDRGWIQVTDQPKN